MFQGYEEKESGQALAEFAIAFPLQLFLIFGIMQVIMIYAATLLANYASYRACRAAVVAQPGDDPLALAKTAAQLVMAPMAGRHIDEDDKAVALKVPGWGELTNSDISGGKVFVYAASDLSSPQRAILVEYNLELIFPVVDSIFALFFKNKAEEEEEKVFGREETGFLLSAHAASADMRTADEVRASAGCVRRIGKAYHIAIVRECAMYNQQMAAKELYEAGGRP